MGLVDFEGTVDFPVAEDEVEGELVFVVGADELGGLFLDDGVAVLEAEGAADFAGDGFFEEGLVIGIEVGGFGGSIEEAVHAAIGVDDDGQVQLVLDAGELEGMVEAIGEIAGIPGGDGGDAAGVEGEDDFLLEDWVIDEAGVGGPQEEG
jgi:hypothetical protein